MFNAIVFKKLLQVFILKIVLNKNLTTIIHFQSFNKSRKSNYAENIKFVYYYLITVQISSVVHHYF